MAKKLYRSLDDRKIAGICGGLGCLFVLLCEEGFFLEAECHACRGGCGDGFFDEFAPIELFGHSARLLFERRALVSHIAEHWSRTMLS